MDPLITTHHTFLPSSTPSLPSFHLHLTRLTSTLFIWVGTGRPSGLTSGGAEGSGAGLEAEALEQAEAAGGDVKRISADWAVAMPSRGNIPVTATPVFRSGSTDIALPMAQRLARKFPSNQVHLSLSLPPSLTASSGPSADPYASRTLLVMEKELGKWLAEVLEA